MSPTTKALAGLLVQLLLVAFAGFLGFSDDVFPGAPWYARGGIAALCLVVALLVGEVARLRAHMAALLQALQASAASSPRDDRAAIDILIGGLSSPKAEVVEKAHRNLRALTKQDFPADPEAWRAWWAGARNTWSRTGSAASGESAAR